MKEFFFKVIGYKKRYRFMSLIRYIQYFLFQRLLGINYNTPWPVHFSSMVSHPMRIKFKKELIPLGYSPGCYIQARNGIEIGSNVIIAPGVKIISSNHEMYDYVKYTKNKPIVIQDNCWLGANCVILPGIELGEHIIVAAGSIVTHSFKNSNCVIGGVPARVIKKIDIYKGKSFYEKQ